MSTLDFTIRPFDLRSASPEDHASLNAFKNALRLEVLPDDPPIPYIEDVQRWRATPRIIQQAAWSAWDASQERILAFAQADIFHTGDNPHVIWCNIEVLPELRRRGLGRSMLRLIADQTRNQGRRLLMVECNDRAPAGAEFLSRIGARKGLDEPLNQLRLADLDHGLVQQWLEREGELSSEFTLGRWDDVYPEEQLEELTRMMQVVANDQPRDTLDVEDIHYSPELFRQFEAAQRAGGDQRWTLYLADRKDGRLAGLSEVFWNPNRPAILHQGFTGVAPEYRNRGLGRWLKAVMLTRILRERPEVQVIRAGNANSNAPMLKLNRALGFRPYVAWATWQVEIDSVEAYLSSRP